VKAIVTSWLAKQEILEPLLNHFFYKALEWLLKVVGANFLLLLVVCMCCV
jgi:hypothetical protein